MPGLALAVPRLNAVLAIDHVQAERQRVDDLLGEDPLAIDLGGARLDFDFEAMRVFGTAERRREQIGDGDDEEVILRREIASRPKRQRAEVVAARRESCDDEAVVGQRRGYLRSLAKLLFDRRRRRGISRHRPRAPKSIDAAQPQRRLRSVELADRSRQHSRQNGFDRFAGGEPGRDLGDRRKRARRVLPGTGPRWQQNGCSGCLRHVVESR